MILLTGGGGVHIELDRTQHDGITAHILSIHPRRSGQIDGVVGVGLQALKLNGLIGHTASIGAQTQHHIFHRCFARIENDLQRFGKTPHPNRFAQHNFRATTRGAGVYIVDTIAHSRGYGILTAGLRNLPSSNIQIRVQRHQSSGGTLHNHLHGISHLAEGANHIGFAILHATEHAGEFIHYHHRLIGTHPREGSRIDGHHGFAHHTFHIDGIVAISVVDDRIVHNTDGIHRILHTRHNGGRQLSVGGSEHAFSE